MSNEEIIKVVLEKIAQEHWNQCREDRPIQGWIRSLHRLPHFMDEIVKELSNET